MTFVLQTWRADLSSYICQQGRKRLPGGQKNNNPECLYLCIYVQKEKENYKKSILSQSQSNFLLSVKH